MSAAPKQWPFPDARHVPGVTPRPETSPAFDAAREAPAYTVDRTWRENQTYLYGVDLYNAGFFWEAHEVWEPVWMRAGGNSRERLAVQGLIQLSNACLKLVMQRPEAARRLLDISRDKLLEASQSGETIMGVDLPDLSTGIHTFRTKIDDGTDMSDTILTERPALTLINPD